MGSRISISVAGLRRDEPDAPWAAGPRAAIAWAGTIGVRAIQLDGSAPGLRARELDRSARRDLAALLRRSELELTGIDLWIPGEHLLDPAHVDRAVSAITGAIGLAGELAPLAGGDRLVSMLLPARLGSDVLAAIAAEADRHGVAIADHAWPPRNHSAATAPAAPAPLAPASPTPLVASPAQSSPAVANSIGLGLDPAAIALAGESITAVAARVADHVLTARLCDLSSAGRVLPGSADGRLDLVGYKVGLSLAPGAVPVVIDVRGLHEQGDAARRMARDWTRA